MHTIPEFIVQHAKRIVHSPVENALVFDRDGQLLQWSFGDKDHVSIMINNECRTMLHNHPNHQCPSMADLLGAMYEGQTEYVCNPDGIYALETTDQVDETLLMRKETKVRARASELKWTIMMDQAVFNRLTMALLLADAEALTVHFVPWEDLA